MTTRTCPHGMPTVGSCLTCMEDDGVGPPPKPPAPDLLFGFIAKFPGRCANCGDNTEAGDQIGKMTDDSYWCHDCVEKRPFST